MAAKQQPKGKVAAALLGPKQSCTVDGDGRNKGWLLQGKWTMKRVLNWNRTDEEWWWSCARVLAEARERWWCFGCKNGAAQEVRVGLSETQQRDNEDDDSGQKWSGSCTFLTQKQSRSKGWWFRLCQGKEKVKKMKFKKDDGWKKRVVLQGKLRLGCEKKEMRACCCRNGTVKMII